MSFRGAKLAALLGPQRTEPETNDFALSRWTLTFAQAETEAEYRRYHFVVKNRHYRVMTIIVPVAILFSFAINEARDGEPLIYGLSRLSALLLWMFGGFALRRKHAWLEPAVHGFAAFLVVQVAVALSVRQYVLSDDEPHREEESSTTLVVVALSGANAFLALYGLASSVLIFSAEIVLAEYFSVGVAHWAMLLRLCAVLYLTRIIYASDLLERQRWIQLRLLETEKDALQIEERRSVRLLRQILPDKVSAELRAGVANPVMFHPQVFCVFFDIVGFTPLSASMTPGELVRMLDHLFSSVDRLLPRHNMEKTQLVGDAVVAIAGLGLNSGPAVDTKTAARNALEFILEAGEVVAELCQSEAIPPIQLRMAVASGSVITGIVGELKFTYSAIGPALDRAIALEQAGRAGVVHADAVVVDLAGLDGLVVEMDPDDDAAVFVTRDLSGGGAPGVPDSELTSVQGSEGEAEGEFVPTSLALPDLGLMAQFDWRFRFADQEDERAFLEDLARTSVRTSVLSKLSAIGVWLMLLVVDVYPTDGPDNHVEAVVVVRLVGLAWIVALACAWHALVAREHWTLARYSTRASIIGQLALQVVVAVLLPTGIELYIDRLQIQGFLTMVIITDTGLPVVEFAPQVAVFVLASLGAYVQGASVGRTLSAGLNLAIVAAVSVAGGSLRVEAEHALYAARQRENLARESLRKEREHTDAMLLNIFPEHVCEQLKLGSMEADHSDNATLMFVVLSGYTELAAVAHPADALRILNTFVGGIDRILRDLCVTKIKSFQSTYMAAAALTADDDQVTAALQVAQAALDILAQAKTLTGGLPSLSVHIGIHSGPATSGVIGRAKIQYDTVGSAANTASRMSSVAAAEHRGCVTTHATAALIRQDAVDARIESIGTRDVKGIGEMECLELAPAKLITHRRVLQSLPGTRRQSMAFTEFREGFGGVRGVVNR